MAHHAQAAHLLDGIDIDLDIAAGEFVTAASVGLVAQMFLLETLGWILATTILFVAGARAFGSRRLALDAAIGLVLTALAFGLFNYGLGLSLPMGSAIEQLLPSDDEEDGAQ